MLKTNCGIGLLLLAVQLGNIAARNKYIFIAPNAFRPGRDVTIHGQLLETPSRPVTVTAKLLQGTTPIASSDVNLSDERNVQIRLNVPLNLDTNNGKKFTVSIKGTGGFSFDDESVISFEKKVTSVFIQTDKAVYKPGQTVHFRVFGVTPDLRIVFDKLKVELYDPKGNKINQWDVSGAEVSNLGGVFIQHQIMSEAPVLGTWKLKAKLFSYGEEFETQTFKVDEYVLPKFEVELDLPAFGRTGDAEFRGKVKATYTFGKPVNGNVDLRIKPKRERFEWKNNKRVSTSKTIELKFPISGNAQFSVPMSRLKEVDKFLAGSSLKFEANVTEDLTHFKQSDKQEVSFYKQPIKLQFPKSLPKTFKPGMTYDAVVKVSLQDDSPPDNIISQLKVTVTEYRQGSKVRRPKPEPIPFEPVTQRPPIFGPFNWRGNPIRRLDLQHFRSLARASDRFARRMKRRVIMPPWEPTPSLKAKTLPARQYTIPLDGIVEFPINTDSDVKKLSVQAEYTGVKTSKTMQQRHSPSNNYLQLRLKTQSPKAGQSVDFDIKTTENVQEVTYQIYARGVLADAGTVNINSRRQHWTFIPTSVMGPKARVVAYYVRSDGEVVADAITINVEGIFENKVEVHFNKTEAAPADTIRMDVAADVGSTVHVLGVDKSVLLMGTGNDVKTGQVLEDLNGYSLKSKSSPSFPVCDWFCWRWPISAGGNDVKDVFEDAGVIVLTDATIYEHREPRPKPLPRPWLRRGGFDAPMMAMDAISFSGSARKARPMARMKSAVNMDIQPVPAIHKMEITPREELAPVERTRKLFPETWLWKTEVVRSSGIARIEEKVPDTITSWIATAFAVHPDTGLGITHDSAQLQVSLPFFASVILPYSVIRGEKVVMQVNIHNYSPQKLFTYVQLDRNPDFENIVISGSTQTTTSIDQTRMITVAANEVRAVYFPIKPRKIGQIDISVKAQSALMSDGVHKKLLVEAEGSPREYNIPFVMDLRQPGTLVRNGQVEFPIRTVDSSERVKVTVIGDLMGPSINGLDKLLKMPTGCGEQNMLKFAPNIFIIKYLEATNSLDNTVMTKAKDFMEKGYQRELTYKHDDGSFSAFGSRDPSGSTWLSAFVVKSFVQAKPYIFIDDDVVTKAIGWLIKHQNVDGTFEEPGRVIHKAMQGGSTSGKVSLTAYVLISLLEARVVAGVSGQVGEAKQKALDYLGGQISSLTDVYDLAIVAYAFQLANDPRANTVWEKLDAKAKVEDGTKYWQRVLKDKTNTKPWQKRNGVAVDIELTAYALLMAANKADRLNGVQILKWVTEQRNPEGGFSSTQDTVIALQGLAEMAAQIYTENYNLTVNIVGNGFTEQFTIQPHNSRVLQTRDMPSNVGAVTVTVTGQGLALVQLEVNYNIDDDHQKQSFHVNVSLPRETINDFDVKICARWLEEGSSSMAVMEIGSPSGFVHDIASIISQPKHKRVDQDLRKAVLYFDEIGSQDTCVTVTLRRIGLIAGIQPVPIRVYDYYEPTKQVTEFYVPLALRNSDMCDICGTECDFCQP